MYTIKALRAGKLTLARCPNAIPFMSKHTTYL